MYNTDLPVRAELPSSRQLLRSTFIALAAALAILVSVVLPAEYGIDPTGIGRALGLAEMGEIKAQLADEAERDREFDRQKSEPAPPPATGPRSDGIARYVAGLLTGTAHAQPTPAAAMAERTDEMKVTLKPGEGTEVKLTMRSGSKVKFAWTVAGGTVNYDMHADGGGKSTSYEKGRAVKGAEGVLVAAFDGNHGWFWRNRGKADVTVTLRTTGAYTQIRQMR